MIRNLIFILIVLTVFACASYETGDGSASPIQNSGTELINAGMRIETIPEPKPVPPVYIMGEGQASADVMGRFLAHHNPRLDLNFATAFARLYIEEASFEGVNHDIAFAQMCVETGYLSFGNLVTPDQNNFAGLGATGLPLPDGTLDKGLYFPDLRTGVRAQIQHLKAYASTEDLNLELVNPRRRFVRLGASPTIDGLAGTWAADRQYAVKIKATLQRLYDLM